MTQAKQELITMQNKRLRSLTIIPPELYVKRAADEQLKNVVADMGRPGYVLVARQMGKTNLLLNAKRELVVSDDVFLYVDLSNSFPDLTQFFRNIIDIALEVHHDKFIRAREKIEKGRNAKLDIPPHKEHEQELRVLLNAIEGKIVICLDEVDALIKVSYSDSVFSLIRSTYFASRINFPEFNRLTYILSGVAEPSVLIKNKNISPFNIGEKIYLDDFTYDEYLDFVRRSGLSLESECVERIFYWADGNPRICWDIGSAIEDLILAGETISIELIDKTVRRLYLLEFDLAPVDHIRKLVEEDRDIRNAVVSIHHRKFQSITDEQRSKLYLSGIIKSDFSSLALKIKNKVIEECLSEDWIANVENSKLSLMDQAQNCLAQKDYRNALLLFKAYEESATSTKEDGPLLFNCIGECYFRLGDYQSTIEYLTKRPFKKSEVVPLYYIQNYVLANAYYAIDEIDKSIECYESIVLSDFPDGYTTTYFEAAVTVSAGPYFNRFEKYKDKIQSLNQHVIDSEAHLLELTEDRSFVNTLVVAAYHNLALAHKLQGQNEIAIRLWKTAITISNISERPKLTASLLEVSTLQEKVTLLSNVFALISSEKIPLQNRDAASYRFDFSHAVFANLLEEAYEVGDESVQTNGLQCLKSEQYTALDAWEVLRYAGLSALGHKRIPAAFSIMREALAIPEKDIGLQERLPILHYALVLSDGSQQLETIENEYLERLLVNQEIDLTEVDFRIIFGILSKYLRDRSLVEARRIFEALDFQRKKLLTIEDALLLASTKACLIAVDYLQLRFLILEEQFEEAIDLAKALKTRLMENLPDPLLLPNNLLKTIRQNIDFILRDIGRINVPTRRNHRKYKPNEILSVKYLDGVIKTGKFKKYKSDIEAGTCDVLNENKYS